ncbi:uncharacterized protein [Medicago truncatula]|uniref:uncharacterized protein n=1 Tax=Medicago truncatula TaxID=3880 RepID=UPI000D2F34E9|nr:uncharacterized protein LOC11443252 [Medicago truncatula]
MSYEQRDEEMGKCRDAHQQRDEDANVGVRNQVDTLSHHLSLTRKSSEMFVVENLLQFPDSVTSSIRAKRGFARHPRSLAKRVRRTRINERMRKLQEVVLNIDKNTSADENGECAAASVHPQPIADPIWRGCLKVSNIGKVIELMGHLSTLACPKVHEEARYLPNMISANFLQKSTVWPESFKNSGTNNFSIGIYFLSPHNPSVDGSFDELVEEMISDKLAIKVGVVNADLLIFPSTDLPSEYRTFQSRYYLWGVFRRKQTSIKNNYIDYKIEKRKLYFPR